MKDANVRQTDELRAFAHSVSAFGQAMVNSCHMGIRECDEAIYLAEKYVKMAREKVEEAERRLAEAEAALAEYESRDHTGNDGRDHYDPNVAAALRRAVEEAQTRLNRARENEKKVKDLNMTVRGEVSTLQGCMASAATSIDSNAASVHSQVNSAADRIDYYKSVR